MEVCQITIKILLGKIMKIIPFLYNDLFIRYDCLLAFTENVELLEVKDVKFKIEMFHKSDNFLHKEHKFYMVHMPKLKDVDMEHISLADYHYTNDKLFLSNESIL